jgi:hypothetical protein
MSMAFHDRLQWRMCGHERRPGQLRHVRARLRRGGDLRRPGACINPSALVLATGLSALAALTTDADHVYWIDTAQYTLNAIAKTGGVVSVLATNQYEIVTSPAPVVDDTYIYWNAHGTLRTRKDGTGSIETVSTSDLPNLAPRRRKPVLRQHRFE